MFMYRKRPARKRVGGRRPPKYGPEFDYCEGWSYTNNKVSIMNTKYFIEGYYGDDRPRKRGLNEIEGDYYDYIEMEDGEEEEGDRDYVNIQA